MNIEQLRQCCLSLPHATEDVKWGNDLCFCIGQKMFCVTGLEAGHAAASFKVTPEEFGEMTQRAGIGPAPYVARYHWVVADFMALSDSEWEHFVRRSYEGIKGKLPADQRKVLG